MRNLRQELSSQLAQTFRPKYIASRALDGRKNRIGWNYMSKQRRTAAKLVWGSDVERKNGTNGPQVIARLSTKRLSNGATSVFALRIWFHSLNNFGHVVKSWDMKVYFTYFRDPKNLLMFRGYIPFTKYRPDIPVAWGFRKQKRCDVSFHPGGNFQPASPQGLWFHISARNFDSWYHGGI